MRSALVCLIISLAGCGSTLARRDVSPDLPRGRALVVGFVLVDGVFNTELTAPYDIFHHTPFHTKPSPGMTVFTVSPDGKPVRTYEGLVIQPDHSFESAPAMDVLVVASAEHSKDSDLEDELLITWVKEVGGKATYVVSLCDGAFVLAKAGLLEGRASTTFPSDVGEYQAMFPQLDVRSGVSFVHDGSMLTSQGGARSFDVALYLVDHIWGPEVARNVARGLVITWPPAAMRADIIGPN